MYVRIFYAFVLTLVIFLITLSSIVVYPSIWLLYIVIVEGILFFVLFITNVLMLIYVIWSLHSGAPYAPTPMGAVETMIRLARIRKSDTLLDLGSGDGRIVAAAAKTGAKCIGIELQLGLYWLSKRRLHRLGFPNVEIVRGSYWKYDFSEVTVLCLFLIPHQMEKLKTKIMREMNPGSKVVSYAFTFPDWPYSQKDGKVYLYKV